MKLYGGHLMKLSLMKLSLMKLSLMKLYGGFFVKLLKSFLNETLWWLLNETFEKFP